MYILVIVLILILTLVLTLVLKLILVYILIQHPDVHVQTVCPFEFNIFLPI